MSRVQSLVVLSRPGEGPLVVTLMGVLLINLTVLCVMVGIRDLRQAAPPTVAVHAMAPTTATPVVSHTPRSISSVPSVVVNRPAVPVSVVRPDRVSREPVDVVIAEAGPGAAVEDAPLGRSAEAGEPADQSADKPVTFFGLPVE